jgi:hypothetical protein
MTIEKEDGTGFSIIRLDEEDLKQLPEVHLPKPEPLSQELLEKIEAAKSALGPAGNLVAEAS